jgi:hypothetical protein
MSQRSALCLAVLVGSLGCASGGGGGGSEAGATPLAWTPGRYLVEATVGSTLSAEEFTGELIVNSPEDITFQGNSGLCQPQTPAEAQRDRADGIRSFNCGSARWEFRPIPGGVRGAIRASILEEYAEQTTCPAGQTPPCTIMRTRQVTRNANLRVSTLNN